MARATPPVVLVVDDDPDVLPIAVAVLTQMGYSVLEAANAADAGSVSAQPEFTQKSGRPVRRAARSSAMAISAGFILARTLKRPT